MRLPATLLLLGTLASPAAAQALPADSVFHRLLGRWVLRGTIAHQATTHDVTFGWMLGHEYLRMEEVSREKDAHGAPQYEAVVLFSRDPKTGEYAALWMDNTGVTTFEPTGVGHGSVAGDSLPFLWRYDSVNSFHNTFVYRASTRSWEWHMDNDSAGVRRPFARVRLTRR